MAKKDIKADTKVAKRAKVVREKTKTKTKTSTSVVRDVPQLVYDVKQNAVDSNLIMGTQHKLIIGDTTAMPEIPDESIQLMVTSPPYFNAPFDYKGLFKNYALYLEMLRKAASEIYRVLQKGRTAVLNIDDMLVDGQKYPIVADATRIFMDAGFRYRDRIIWKKPDGYLRISRRSGVLLQNPYPMYYYPDNLLESIVIFQKGKFDYRTISQEKREESRLNLKEFSGKKWYMTLWQMNNVMPGATLEKDIAAFPVELPYRIIKLFSYKGETVLDPSVGSGTTMKVARDLGTNSNGIEINEKLLLLISEKFGFSVKERNMFANENDIFEIIKRNK